MIHLGFGQGNLKMAGGMVRIFNKKYGVGFGS